MLSRFCTRHPLALHGLVHDQVHCVAEALHAPVLCLVQSLADARVVGDRDASMQAVGGHPGFPPVLQLLLDDVADMSEVLTHLKLLNRGGLHKCGWANNMKVTQWVVRVRYLWV